MRVLNLGSLLGTCCPIGKRVRRGGGCRGGRRHAARKGRREGDGVERTAGRDHSEHDEVGREADGERLHARADELLRRKLKESQLRHDCRSNGHEVSDSSGTAATLCCCSVLFAKTRRCEGVRPARPNTSWGGWPVAGEHDFINCAHHCEQRAEAVVRGTATPRPTPAAAKRNLLTPTQHKAPGGVKAIITSRRLIRVQPTARSARSGGVLDRSMVCSYSVL